MEVKRLTGTKLKALDDAGKGMAVFATLNVIDKDGDVTLPGAFGEQLAKVVPAHDWGHVPLGKARIFESANEAIADFGLNLEIEAARDWHAALKYDLADGKPLQEWSYGFDILEWSGGEFEGKSVRFLKKLKVHEVSPVIVGAGEGTRTLTIKGRKLSDHVNDVCVELDELIVRVRDLKRLRAAEGRGISKERYAQLRELKAALDRLSSASIETGEILGAEPAELAEARKLYSQFVQLTTGRRA